MKIICNFHSYGRVPHLMQTHSVSKAVYSTFIMLWNWTKIAILKVWMAMFQSSQHCIQSLLRRSNKVKAVRIRVTIIVSPMLCLVKSAIYNIVHSVMIVSNLVCSMNSH